MAAGLPVAAFLQEASDGFALIEAAKCGVVANSADPSACLRAIEKLMSQQDEFGAIGNCGKQYAIEHLSKEHCVSQLEAMLAE